MRCFVITPPPAWSPLDRKGDLQGQRWPVCSPFPHKGLTVPAGEFGEPVIGYGVGLAFGG
jgi:hypothetical protein